MCIVTRAQTIENTHLVVPGVEDLGDCHLELETWRHAQSECETWRHRHGSMLKVSARVRDMQTCEQVRGMETRRRVSKSFSHASASHSLTPHLLSRLIFSHASSSLLISLSSLLISLSHRRFLSLSVDCTLVCGLWTFTLCTLHFRHRHLQLDVLGQLHPLRTCV